MNEVRRTIISPEKVLGEGMKVNDMTRGMLYGKDFGKSRGVLRKDGRAAASLPCNCDSSVNAAGVMKAI